MGFHPTDRDVPALKAIKIEPGKSYKDRWGDVHGPMDERALGCLLDQHGAVYQPDGRQWNHLAESMSTLIVEDETAAK